MLKIQITSPLRWSKSLYKGRKWTEELIGIFTLERKADEMAKIKKIQANTYRDKTFHTKKLFNTPTNDGISY